MKYIHVKSNIMELKLKVRGKGYAQLKRIRKLHDDNPKFIRKTFKLTIQ